MDDSHQASAEKVRSLIERGLHDRGMFRAALLSVPPAIRDGWLDVVFGLGDLPNDGPELPRGCVPYLPSSVDALLRVVEQAPVRGSDIFVDVGSGLGRAAALVHLLTGAAVIGLEISRTLSSALAISRHTCSSRASRPLKAMRRSSRATSRSALSSSSTAPSVANAWREFWETWSTSPGRGSFASAASICLFPRAPG